MYGCCRQSTQTRWTKLQTVHGGNYSITYSSILTIYNNSNHIVPFFSRRKPLFLMASNKKLSWLLNCLTALMVFHVIPYKALCMPFQIFASHSVPSTRPRVSVWSPMPFIASSYSNRRVYVWYLVVDFINDPALITSAPPSCHPSTKSRHFSPNSRSFI